MAAPSRCVALQLAARRHPNPQAGTPALPMNFMKTKLLGWWWLLVVLVSLLAAWRAGAEEKLAVLTAGDLVYSNVTVTSVSVTDIFFTYDRGMANARLKELSPELQKHFHFNGRKAAVVEKRQAEANTQYHVNSFKQSAASVKSDAGGSRANAGPGKQLWAKSFLNQKAPELVVEKWLTPEPDRKGKFVLIDFWATWCPPCRRAIAELNGFHHKFGDRLVVIGLSDETEAAVRRLASPKIDYAVAIDRQARMKNIVEVTGIPHVLIIDPHGIVRWEGYPFLEGQELNEAVVADILAHPDHRALRDVFLVTHLNVR